MSDYFKAERVRHKIWRGSGLYDVYDQAHHWVGQIQRVQSGPQRFRLATDQRDLTIHSEDVFTKVKAMNNLQSYNLTGMI